MRQAKQKRPPSRRIVAWVLSIAAVICVALAALLAGSLFLHQNQSNPLAAANQGHMFLYVSSSRQPPDAKPDTLTMLNSSDGKVLWHYHIQTFLVDGTVMPHDIDIKQAIQIINGVVYFAITNASTNSYIDNTGYQLLALRASDGKVLWQQSVKIAYFQILTVTNGSVCALVGPNANGLRGSDLSVYAYRTQTGSLSWQHRLSDLGATSSPSVYALAQENILYLTSGFFSFGEESELTAMNPDTGEVLWRKKQPFVINFGMVPGPLASSQGISVLELANPTSSSARPKQRLAGWRTSDGQQMWQFDTDFIPSINLNNEARVACLAAQGILYVATLPASDDRSIGIYALRILDGTLLWQKHLSYEKAVLLDDLQLADGAIYVATSLTAPTANPSPRGGSNVDVVAFSITALQASDGTQRWQHEVSHQILLPALAISDGSALFLRDQGTLSALNPANGTLSHHYTFPTEGFADMFMAGGVVVFSYQDRVAETPGDMHLVAFQQNRDSLLWQQDERYIYGIVLGP